MSIKEDKLNFVKEKHPLKIFFILVTFRLLKAYKLSFIIEKLSLKIYSILITFNVLNEDKLNFLKKNIYKQYNISNI